MDRIKVIALDLVGTLIPIKDWNPLHRAHLRVLTVHLAKTVLNKSNEEVRKILAKEREVLSKKLKRDPTLLETFSSLGVRKKTFYYIIDNVDPSKYLKANRKVAEAVLRLKSDYVLSIVTDTSRKTTERALKAYGIRLDCFHVIVCGDDVAKIKPDKEAFRVLLKKVECKPQDILFIGDREDIDLDPAKELGMKTALIEEGHSSVDMLINSLLHFVEFVQLFSVRHGAC